MDKEIKISRMVFWGAVLGLIVPLVSLVDTLISQEQNQEKVMHPYITQSEPDSTKADTNNGRLYFHQTNLGSNSPVNNTFVKGNADIKIENVTQNHP